MLSVGELREMLIMAKYRHKFMHPSAVVSLHDIRMPAATIDTLSHARGHGGSDGAIRILVELALWCMGPEVRSR